MPYASAPVQRDYAREYYRQNRLRAIQILGGQCVHCGVNDPIVLDIDHVHNDGAKERRTLTTNQVAMRIVLGTLDIRRYQLLCKNCNWRKEILRRDSEGRARRCQ